MHKICRHSLFDHLRTYKSWELSNYIGYALKKKKRFEFIVTFSSILLLVLSCFVYYSVFWKEWLNSPGFCSTDFSNKPFCRDQRTTLKMESRIVSSLCVAIVFLPPHIYYVWGVAQIKIAPPVVRSGQYIYIYIYMFYSFIYPFICFR